MFIELIAFVADVAFNYSARHAMCLCIPSRQNIMRITSQFVIWRTVHSRLPGVTVRQEVRGSLRNAIIQMYFIQPRTKN